MEAFLFDGNAYCSECINHGRAMRWCLDEKLAAKDENSCNNDDNTSNGEHDPFNNQLTESIHT